MLSLLASDFADGVQEQCCEECDRPYTYFHSSDCRACTHVLQVGSHLPLLASIMTYKLDSMACQGNIYTHTLLFLLLHLGIQTYPLECLGQVPEAEASLSVAL